MASPQIIKFKTRIRSSAWPRLLSTYDVVRHVCNIRISINVYVLGDISLSLPRGAEEYRRPVIRVPVTAFDGHDRGGDNR